MRLTMIAVPTSQSPKKAAYIVDHASLELVIVLNYLAKVAKQIGPEELGYVTGIILYEVTETVVFSIITAPAGGAGGIARASIAPAKIALKLSKVPALAIFASSLSKLHDVLLVKDIRKLDRVTSFLTEPQLAEVIDDAVDVVKGRKRLDEVAPNSAGRLGRARSDRLARLAASNYSRRATELVNEAASASGVKLTDIVDVVRSTRGPSFFDVDPDTGRRILAISEDAFSRSRAHRLVEAAHEIVHAQRYNNVLRARGGDFATAYHHFFNITDELYALDDTAIAFDWPE